MVIELTPEQRALVADLMRAKVVAERELNLVLTTLRSTLGEGGTFESVKLEGNVLRFLGDVG